MVMCAKRAPPGKSMRDWAKEAKALGERRTSMMVLTSRLGVDVPLVILTPFVASPLVRISAGGILEAKVGLGYFTERDRKDYGI